MKGPQFREASLRDLILAVMMIGMLGLTAELLLMEHTETWEQWIPIVVLSLGVGVTVWSRLRSSRASVRAFSALMALYLGAGLLGVYFHYAGNVEFVLERTPELSGLALAWEALRGATPALAPGAMAQLGLLGLVYAYGHPASSKQEVSSNTRTESER